jgi:hypothetical protein
MTRPPAPEQQQHAPRSGARRGGRGLALAGLAGAVLQIQHWIVQANQAVLQRKPFVIAIHLQPQNPIGAQSYSRRLLGMRLPTILQTHRLADVQRDVIRPSDEVDDRIIRQGNAVVDRLRWQLREIHHAPRRSVSARRSRYTMCPLRLRSSSLAQSVSAECRSAGNRRMRRAIASAISTGYTTLTSPQYHDTIIIPPRHRNGIKENGGFYLIGGGRRSRTGRRTARRPAWAVEWQTRSGAEAGHHHPARTAAGAERRVQMKREHTP